MTHHAEAQIAATRAHRTARVTFLLFALFAVSGVAATEGRFGDTPLNTGRSKPWTLRLERGDVFVLPGVDEPGMLGMATLDPPGWNFTFLPSRLPQTQLVGRGQGIVVPLFPVVLASLPLLLIRRQQSRDLQRTVSGEISKCSDMQGVRSGPLDQASSDSSADWGKTREKDGSQESERAVSIDGPPRRANDVADDILKGLEAA